jgi:hypothetical protein
MSKCGALHSTGCGPGTCCHGLKCLRGDGGDESRCAADPKPEGHFCNTDAHCASGLRCTFLPKDASASVDLVRPVGTCSAPGGE